MNDDDNVMNQDGSSKVSRREFASRVSRFLIRVLLWSVYRENGLGRPRLPSRFLWPSDLDPPRVRRRRRGGRVPRRLPSALADVTPICLVLPSRVLQRLLER